MPAKSKQQQKFMGMVHALKKGDIKPSDVSQSVRDAAKSMKKSDAKDFASTKHKGLPKKVKQEILNKLKEYANSMGRDHLGGDDYTSSKKGGLRDNDGYDNVDYNPNMKMDESNLKGQLAGDSVQDIIKSIGSRFVSGEIKNTKRDGKTYIKLKDEKFGSGVVKILKSRFGIDAKVDYYGGKGTVASSPSVSFYSDTILEGVFSTIDHIRQNSKNVRDFIKNVLSDKDFRDMKNDKNFIKYLGSIYEGKLPNNWMSGRVSDYHTSLRGKKKDYSDGTNFKKDNSGQPDLEDEEINEATKPDFNSKGYKEGTKLVSKLRSSVFKKMSDHDLEQFRMVIAQAFDLREYASKLTLSYLPADEEEIEKMNEAMIRRAVDLAQEILPKDTWSKYANDGKKNKEFVKNIVRDLAQSLNRFYKNHNINVKIQN